MITYFLPPQKQFTADKSTELVPNETRSPVDLKDALKEARSKTKDILDILDQIAHDPTQYGSTRVAACARMLDFAWGKPGTVAQHSELGDESEVIEMTAIQALSPEERFNRAKQVMRILEEEVLVERGN